MLQVQNKTVNTLRAFEGIIARICLQKYVLTVVLAT